ncbi:hypothetical protein [Agrobacterium vitis]|uniref:Uncharacterized protein n=1 Tax=Agrobacterium vitis TaxID=373 RepID=A0AAE2US88_AGRVI|nr:hypothetical protein [Agrobacterium vitis]MBF2715683.1 hypothetical protein [Agrobacterium vitis]
MADKPIPFSGPMVRAMLDGRKTQTRRAAKAQPVAIPYRHPILREGDVEWPIGPGLSIVSNKPNPPDAWAQKNIRYSIGDRLWVKEAFIPDPPSDDPSWNDNVATYVEWSGCGSRLKDIPAKLRDSDYCIFAADGLIEPGTIRWVSGMFMPRWASRLTLIVTDVRIMRMQDITDADAIAEGATYRLECRGDALEDIGWSMDWGPIDSGKVLDIDHCLSTAGGAFLNYFHTLNKFPKKYGDDPSMWPNPWVAAYTFRVIKSNIDRVTS